MKTSEYSVLDNRPINQWKVTELKEELKRRKLPIRGLKEELVRRLDEAIRSDSETAKEEITNGVNDSHPAADAIVAESVPLVDEISVVGSQSNTTESQFTNDVVDHSNTEDNSLGIKPFVDGIVTGELLHEDHDENKEALADVKPQENEISMSMTNTPEEVDDALSDHLSPEVSLGQGSRISVSKKEDENPGAMKTLDDTRQLDEDGKLDVTDTTLQVSEVSVNLGSQVNHDSIASDSLYNNEVNDMKDDIIADDVQLVIDVKPEIVQPSTGDVVPPSSNESLSGDFEKRHEDKVLIAQAYTNVPDTKMSEIDNAAKFGSAEKLNLDRSSGDDSLEDDASESKQLDSTYESNETGKQNKESDLSMVEKESRVDAMDDDLFVEKKSVDAKNNTGIDAVTEKRKLSDHAVEMIEPEPAKRQRRWNSGKNLMVSEPNSLSIASSTTPKTISQHSSPKLFSSPNTNTSQDTPEERIVPPPRKSPTNSLWIDRFLRPFTLKAVQELLGRTGTVTSFWMDQIKTHCYVTYSTEDEAIKTRNALYNLQWPPNGGRLLVAEFVEPDEVKLRLEPPAPQPQVTTPIVAGPAAPVSPVMPSKTLPRLAVTKQQKVPQQPAVSLPLPPPLPNLPPARELIPPRPAPPPEKINSPIVTLDDLFRRTEATPRIYYLPLTEEQVSSKVRSRA